MPPNLAQEITAHLTSKGLPPTRGWLDGFVGTVRPHTALPAVKQTALFRILASDITQSLARSPGSVFPAGTATALDGTIKERVLPGPIAVQVLDVEDIGRSRWSQVEALEAAERGETTKGREVIRVVPDDEQDQGGGGGGGGGVVTAAAAAAAAAGNGPHKLLLVDAAGTRVYGIELFPVDGVDSSMSIGAKLVLQSVVVARGLLLLEPRTAQVVGGKVEALHKAWMDGRLQRLREAARISEERG